MQITRTIPLRRMTLQFSQIPFTDGRTFILDSMRQYITGATGLTRRGYARQRPSRPKFWNLRLARIFDPISNASRFRRRLLFVVPSNQIPFNLLNRIEAD
jgi:hypothetical protein